MPETLVVYQSGFQLEIRRQLPERIERVTNIIYDLHGEMKVLEDKLWGEGDRARHTLHLSGMSPSASGKRALRVFCTMDEVMETPQTVPRDRSRYTVDTETAWSTHDRYY